MSRDHGTHFIETEALLDVLEENEDAAEERLRTMLPGELRQLIYAAFNLAEVGQEVERQRSHREATR